MPLNPVMTLVEAQGQVVALYNQNELHKVAPGDEAEFGGIGACCPTPRRSPEPTSYRICASQTERLINLHLALGGGFDASSATVAGTQESP
jgi:hypothetical protein